MGLIADMVMNGEFLVFYKGGSSSGGSGGGSSGLVDYPDYMKGYHEAWLDQLTAGDPSVPDMYTAQDNNPYISAATHNPAPNLTLISTELEIFRDKIDEAINDMNPYKIFDDAFDIASENLKPFPEELIEEEVESFARIQDTDYARSMARVESGLNEIGASLSSALAIGRSLVALEKQRIVANHSANVHLEVFLRNRQMEISFVGAITDQFLKYAMSKFDMWKAFMMLYFDYQRTSIASMKDYEEQSIVYDVKAVTFGLDVFAYGANMLGAIAGTAVSVPPDGEDNKQSSSAIMGGALGGAGLGLGVAALLGATSPWLLGGAALGGGILGGGLASLF